VREIRNERERWRGKEGGREIDMGRYDARLGYRGTLRVSAREGRGERGRVRERRN
jgi:hypothetical protein